MRASIVIRPAVAADIPALGELLEVLFSLEADFRFDPVHAQRGLELMLREPRAAVLVADDAGVAVGMVTMQELISTAEGGRVGLVEDMVVRDDYRGRGIGRALLSGIEAEARNRDYRRVQLLADRDNWPAREFYEICGWLPTALVALRRRP